MAEKLTNIASRDALKSKYEAYLCLCSSCLTLKFGRLEQEEGLFIWEVGRDKQQGGTIFILPLTFYVDFFNRDGINRHDVMISVLLFWAWQALSHAWWFSWIHGSRSCNFRSMFNIWWYYLILHANVYWGINK